MISRENPYLVSIKERYSLSSPFSEKRTQHIALDIADVPLTFEPGDSVGVFPTNPPDLVEKTLLAIRAKGTETIIEKRTGKEWNLHDFLTQKANLKGVSRRLLQDVVKRIPGSSLGSLSSAEQKSYLAERELWDFFKENKEAYFSLQELADLLMPLLPRLYSIASSKKVVKDEIHLTVAPLTYEANGNQRIGICTSYLCDQVPLNQPVVPIYIQKNPHFSLPEDPTVPMIMVGPGTGVAPYRAFMQERILDKNGGKNWLFFGEWREEHDFFYAEFWKQLQKRDLFQLDCAFSRDQAHKVYVQHKMAEKGAELFAWLEEGAYLFVCGDAERMAKDVDQTLLEIVQTHGKRDTDAAKEYIKQLRRSKRYLRDVY